jgi:hypothetical protein
MKYWPIKRFLLLFIAVLYTLGCKNDFTPDQQPDGKTFQVRQMKVPLWVRNSSIYEVNIRQ